MLHVTLHILTINLPKEHHNLTHHYFYVVRADLCKTLYIRFCFNRNCNGPHITQTSSDCTAYTTISLETKRMLYDGNFKYLYAQFAINIDWFTKRRNKWLQQLGRFLLFFPLPHQLLAQTNCIYVKLNQRQFPITYDNFMSRGWLINNGSSGRFN